MKKDTGPTKAVRAQVLDRDDRCCFRCGIPVAWFGSYSIHHRRPRGMGGTNRPDTNLPANLLVLCGTGNTGCHGYIESHRTEASNLGFLLSVHVTDPEEWPVREWHGTRCEVHLCNDEPLLSITGAAS